jgi:hypothetical protein
MYTDPSERRLKIIHVLPEFLITAGRWDVHGPLDTICIPVFDIPEGFKVRGVNYDPMYQAWVVTIWHESFDVVPLGGMIPREDAIVKAVPVWELLKAAIKNAD